MIKIGDAVSLGRPTDWTYTPDDRQKQVEIIGGVSVQDFGHVAAGDKFSFSAQFENAQFAKIVEYWNKRILVDITDQGGNTWAGCRVILKSYSYVEKFEKKVVKATLEIWRV